MVTVKTQMHLRHNIKLPLRYMCKVYVNINYVGPIPKISPYVNADNSKSEEKNLTHFCSQAFWMRDTYLYCYGHPGQPCLHASFQGNVASTAITNL